MGIYQEGTAPKEEKGIFPKGAKVERIITHDMMVVGGELRINADDRENFRAECYEEIKELEKLEENG